METTMPINVTYVVKGMWDDGAEYTSDFLHLDTALTHALMLKTYGIRMGSIEVYRVQNGKVSDRPISKK